MIKKSFLFIIPPCAETLWSSSARIPYYGVAQLSSYLRSKKIHTEIIDCQADLKNVADFKKELAKKNPSHIGIPLIYGNVNNAYIIARICKNFFPNIKIICGGLPATFAYERIFTECPEIDICVRGEGEETIFELTKKNILKNITGIAYHSRNEIITNKEKKLITDLDKYPFPDYSFFQNKIYEKGHYPYETSRGCPFFCKFCCQGRKEGKILREKSINKVLSDFEKMVDIGIKKIMIVDNDFLTNINRAKIIFTKIIEKNLNKKASFFLATRVSNILRERNHIVDLMKKANVDTVFLGIESLSKKNRKEIGKIKSIKELKKLFFLLDSKKIMIIPAYMIGFPNETLEDIKETFKKAVYLNTKIIKINIFTPYPGTEIYNEMTKNKSINPQIPLEKYDGVHKVFYHSLDLEKIMRNFTKNYYERKDFFDEFGKKYYRYKLNVEKKLGKTKKNKNEFNRQDLSIEKNYLEI
jgi:anaerobic magnesium-protoporphyrin IX monomethyl ester cyclase